MSFLRFKKSQSGFSLVEMMVVIGIFTVITGVVLFNLPQFRDQTVLELIAQDMAITIRQAQVFGISTRAFSDKFPSHGAFFNLVDNAQLDPWKKSFVLFADVDGNDNNYSVPTESCFSNDECVEQFNIQGPVEIKNLLACINGACNPISPGELLTVAFVRPNPEAVFLPPLPGLNKVKIRLQSTRNLQCRNVVVWITGQIYVENDPTCNNNT